MKSNRAWVTNAIVAIVVVIAFVAVLVARSGALDKDPVVEAAPDNCYSETLHVITDSDYRPYSFYGANGEFSGHDVELITLIANELHMNLDLRFLPWDECLETIESGDADLLMTCDYTDTFAGEDQIVRSEPVSYDDFIVYSRAHISTPDDLYDKRIAIMENGNALPRIEMLGLLDRCVRFDDNRQAMQALVDGKVDCAIMRNTVGTVLLQDLGASGIEGYISIGQSYLCFGIYDRGDGLADRVNGIIDEMRLNGEMIALRDKWLTTFVEPYTLFEVLNLNIWIIPIFVAVVLVVLVLFVRNMRLRKRGEEEKKRADMVIEKLASDFECVNFVTVRADKSKDTVALVRLSDELRRNIPGWEEEQIFSKRLDMLCDAIVVPEDRERFIAQTRREVILENLGKNHVYHVNFKALIDGTVRYYQLKFAAVEDEHGRILGFVTGVHNTDEQTRREIAAKEQLEAANKSKTDFLFNMSHDIRTPMNAIMGFTNMAIKRIDDREKVLDYLSKTQQSGNLLLSLINSVLDMSRIESGNAVLVEEEGDVRYSFANIETTMRELAATRDIELTFEVEDITDCYVFCDYDRCNRIFVNIISNAIKYTPEGGRVRVRCEQLGRDEEGRGVYRYSFEDNGIGMSEEFQRHVFEQFSREESTTLSGVQGTGLGLSVCKSFVELMGGTIECRSTLGVGTTFIVTLPFRLQEGEYYVDPLTREVRDASEGAAARDAVSLRGKRVLLVEDNELNREIALDILEEAGLFVEEAVDGADAVRIFAERGPGAFDFVLMDIQMPVMDGYAATAAIRELPGGELPIIALSANAFKEDEERSLAAGMDAHVAKPINVAELLAVLAALEKKCY